MFLKSNLHLHTSDDPHDVIPYSFFDVIDEAVRLKFDVIAVTCHGQVIDKIEYRKYAAKQGVLFVPGVELRLKEGDLVLLNARKSAENIKTVADLREYKSNHPEILTLVPHPFYILSSFGKHLEKNIDVIDAIEISWFYSKFINFNKKAKRVAEQHNIPLIATSDTHELRWLNNSYSVIKANNKTIESVFRGITKGKIENFSEPISALNDMVPFLLQMFSNRRG